MKRNTMKLLAIVNKRIFVPIWLPRMTFHQSEHRTFERNYWLPFISHLRY